MPRVDLYAIVKYEGLVWLVSNLLLFLLIRLLLLLLLSFFSRDWGFSVDEIYQRWNYTTFIIGILICKATRV